MKLSLRVSPENWQFYNHETISEGLRHLFGVGPVVRGWACQCLRRQCGTHVIFFLPLAADSLCCHQENHYMKSDLRYKVVGNLIKTGFISTYREVFTIIPLSTVATDMSLPYQSLYNRVYGPLWLTIQEVIVMAKLLDMEPQALFTFTYKGRKEDLKSPGAKFNEAKKKP